MLLSAGQRDPSFSADGILTTNFSPDGFAATEDEATSLDVAPDGKIVAAGTGGALSAGSLYAVARYNPDGKPDTAFGTFGKVTVPTGSSGSLFRNVAVAVQPSAVLTRHRFARSSNVAVSTRALKRMSARRPNLSATWLK